MFLRLAIPVAAAALTFAVVPPADGHKLSWREANRFMTSVAYDDYLATPATQYFGGCATRKSPHAFRCLEILWFNEGGSSAIGQWETCAQNGVVRFRSRRTRRLVFVYEPYKCYSDQQPTGGATPGEPPPTSEPVTTNNGGPQWRWIWDGPLTEWPTFFTP